MTGFDVFYVLAGLAGGVFGGMGLGGGTLLIPILTLLLNVDARLAAWLNLLTFLPMSCVALFIHCKNRLVAWKEVCSFVPTAFVSAAFFSLLSTGLEGVFLRRLFGWFLIVTGSVSFIVSLVRSAQNEKTSKIQ